MSGRKDLPLLVAESNWIDGVPYIKDVTEETLRKLPDIPVYEDDVYIAGYPKSGTLDVAVLFGQSGTIMEILC